MAKHLSEKSIAESFESAVLIEKGVADVETRISFLEFMIDNMTNEEVFFISKELFQHPIHYVQLHYQI